MWWLQFLGYRVVRLHDNKERRQCWIFIYWDDKRLLFTITCLLSTEAVLKKTDSLDTNKSVGPDNIHPMLLRRLANELEEPLTVIFQKSLNEGQLPDDWRNAIISPIHKKGSKVTASNYRPISLTSIACKILESFVKEAVIKFLTEEKLISSKQYGFMNGRYI